MAALSGAAARPPAWAAPTLKPRPPIAAAVPPKPVETALRRASLDDLDTLVLHRRLMWRDIGGFTDEQLAEADAPYRRWMRQRLRSGRLVGWVAEDGAGRPVASGCVWVQRVQPRPLDPTGEQPYLLSMYTAPAARGSGVAARIVDAAEAWCRENGFTRLTLHAAPMGRNLYARAGFERTWEMIRRFPADD